MFFHYFKIAVRVEFEKSVSFMLWEISQIYVISHSFSKKMNKPIVAFN